jgi:hypothetical protein
LLRKHYGLTLVLDKGMGTKQMRDMARCPFRKSLVSIFAGQRVQWEGMLT